MQKILQHLLLITLLLIALAPAKGQNLSLDFDGVDDDVEVDLTTTSLGLNPTDLTVELWFRSTDATASPLPCPDGMRTLVRLTGQNFNLELAECNGQLFVSEYFGLGPLPPVMIGSTTRNQWQHLRIDYDATGFDLYLDCILVHSNTNTLPVGVAKLYLAEFNAVTGVNQPRHWRGQIDELRIWQSQQAADPTCAQPYCPLAGTEPDLLAYWNFDQGIGNGNNAPLATIPDQTANGNDGTAANFVGNGSTSNLVSLGAPLIGPALHGLNLTIRDYPYQVAPLTTICSGDPAHFTLDWQGAVPGPFGNVGVVWEYSDDAGATWLLLNSPPFTDFQFPILPGGLTANCGPSPTGFVDRIFRAIATVTEAGTGRQCVYQSGTDTLRICCPVSPFTVNLQPNAPLCEGESVNLTVSLNSPDAWVNTPGPNTTIRWEVTDENGTRPLAQNQQTSFSYAYTAPALTTPLDVCFTAYVTNCNGKMGSDQACIRIDPEPECGLIDALPLGAPQHLRPVAVSPYPIYDICPGEDAILGIDPANPFDKCVPQWQYSFDNLSWTDLGFSNSIQNTNVLPSHLWPAGADRIYYRIECRPLSNPSGCDPCYSNLLEIRLALPPAATSISGSTQECLEDILVAPVLLSVNNPVAGVTYQWLYNGRPFGTGISQMVTEPGCYWLESSTACTTVAGSKHCLDICETVAILSCPLAPNDCARLGDPVTLSACDSYNTCSPGAALGYKWYVDGVFQPGQSGCTFSFLPDPAGTTVRVDVVDPITGCAGSADRTVIPCDF